MIKKKQKKRVDTKQEIKKHAKINFTSVVPGDTIRSGDQLG